MADDAGSTLATVAQNAKAMASKALKDGDLKTGRFLAQRLLMALPDDPEALLLVAQSDILAGHIGPARALLDCALSLAPDLTVLRNQKATLEQQDAKLARNTYVHGYLVGRAMHMDYPQHIQLETVGRCNANCTFCPHEQLDRKFEEMSDTLFDKIIAEAATIPPDNPVDFYLNGVNEPFMDKKIFARVKRINDLIPHATLGFYTNMNALPRDFFEEIREVRQRTSLNVSFNAANEAEYQASMRIDFNRTVTNIRKFLAENREHRILASPLILSRIATRDDGDDRFRAECPALFPEFESGVDFVLRVRNRASWLGQIDGANQTVPSLLPCMQWLNITVQCNGTVPHCCMDATGKFAFGNVNERSLLEIYNSPEFRSMREGALGRAAIYPCNTCALT
jgi:sulfatase maturation enzyme AslB (radical SAM superfamily)